MCARPAGRWTSLRPRPGSGPSGVTLPRAGLAVLLCLLWAGPAATGPLIDALGRAVSVPAPPHRIVSLVPSVTEILYALGLRDRVVGVTRFCTFPPEARTKPKVGGYADPNLEAIVGLRPDLVFAGADSSSPALVSRLESLGVPVYVVYPRSLRETADTLRAVGKAAGAPEAGEREATRFSQAVAEAEAAAQSDSRPRVLLCVMTSPLVVAGPGTSGDDLIRAAGGRNVVPPSAVHYPTWNSETLLAADPDVIVLAPHERDTDPAEYFRRWPRLKAVADRRIAVIEADWIHRPGPRLILGLKALVRALQLISP